MTVAELLKILEEYPPHAEVFIAGGKDDDTDNWPITDVLHYPGDPGGIILLREIEEMPDNQRKIADHIDGYDRDDLGESPDY